ncbi:MAG: YihA family ribosome biogenesis GTP-binding protein [Ruminococcaceae bacterium]|nr:YihA family ribosome biogenesis GTP-binding protein [Oscillospiraceae bacterium]
MNVNQAELSISAVSKKQYPKGGYPEIVFAGRSNVGKSSLINKLCNRNKLARISASPGKTATINFYDIEHKLYFVDLPGYGYAKVSWSERQKWADMINEYLEESPYLATIFLLVDSRHKPTKDDCMMMEWIKSTGLEYRIIATKSDKISKKAAEENRQVIMETLALSDPELVLLFSSKTGAGKEVVWDYIDSIVERSITHDCT